MGVRPFALVQAGSGTHPAYDTILGVTQRGLGATYVSGQAVGPIFKKQEVRKDFLSVDWYSLTDVSAQRDGPICKGQAVREKLLDARRRDQQVFPKRR